MNAAQTLALMFMGAALSGQHRHWPPHRNVGTPKRARKPAGTARLRITVKHGRIEIEERQKLSGGKGLR